MTDFIILFVCLSSIFARFDREGSRDEGRMSGWRRDFPYIPRSSTVHDDWGGVE